MSSQKVMLCLGSALCAFAAPAYAQTAQPQAADSPSTIDDIVVTARRESEALSKVPIAVTALSQDELSARGTYTIQDLQQDVPGLTVNPTTGDRNNITYSIRGQGYAYGTLFPAVITYFQEVPVANFTSGQFFDLENVQILRGPQGVSFGRVTDGGNVMVAPHKPTDEFGGSVEARYGNLDMRAVTGVLNVPIIGDKLAVRGAFEVMRRDGFTTNVANGQKLDSVRYETYRIGVLARPADGIENYTVVQYQRTHDSGTSVHLGALNEAGLTNSLNGLIGPTGLFSGGLVAAAAGASGAASAANPGNAALAAFASSLAGAYKGPLYGLNAQGNIVGFGSSAMVSPLTLGNYLTSLRGQLAQSQALGPRRVNYTAPSFDRRKNLYVVNVTDIDLSDNIQLKNVFGYIRVRQKNASNFAGTNGNLIITPHSGINQIAGVSPEPGDGYDFYSQKQISDELRLSGKAFDDRLDWSLGAYYDNQKPASLQQNDTINVAVLQRTNVPITETKSKALYGAFEFALVEGLKVNGGLRYTWDSVDTDVVTYIRPLSFPVVSGGNTIDATTAFASVIQSAIYLGSLASPTGPVLLTPAQALGAAQATFAPIPHGQCTSYGGPLFPAACVNFKQKFEAFTWSGGVSYEATQNTLLYGKMSKGYRPGGTNASTSPGFETYNPEFDYSIELGAKTRFNTGGMQGRFSLALYRDKYKSIQKLIAVSGAGGTPVSIITNAAAGTIKGVEFEGTLVPVAGLSFDATAAYTDAKYKSGTEPVPATDPRFPCNPAANSILGFCSANRFAFTPKFQYSVAVHYDMDLPGDAGSIRFGGRYYHQSSIAMTDFSMLARDGIEPAYGLLDLDARWRNVGGAPIDIGLFANNVTNKLYRQANDNLNYAASVGVRGDIYAAPRTYGIAVKYRFGGEAN